MNKPLKFKSYNPGLQGPQRSKKKASLANMHSSGLVLQEHSEQRRLVAEIVTENHGKTNDQDAGLKF